MNRGYFLPTKVQHENPEHNCGEDCTQHFREGILESAIGIRAGAVKAGSGDGIEKEQKTAG